MVTIAPLQPPEPVPERVVRLQEQFDDVVEIRRTNPQIYYRGRIFKVPTYLMGTYQLVTNDTGFTLFDTTDGARRVSSSRCLCAWPPASDWCRCGRSLVPGSAIRIHPGN